MTAKPRSGYSSKEKKLFYPRTHMSVLPCELAGKWKFSLSIGRSVAKKSFLSYGDIEYRVGVVFLCCV